MALFLLPLALVCLYKIRFWFLEKPKVQIYDDYMSLEKSTSIKGIFILIVLLSHASSYLTLSDGILDRLYLFFNGRILGQSMVSLFMLYSGYAVMLSIMKKGRGYVLKMPKNRILMVLLHFDIAILIFLLVQTCIGKTFPASQIVLSFTGWMAIGNSNWYIFVILVSYLISFVSFAIAKDKYKLGVAIQFVLTVAFILFLRAFKDLYWYDTALLYPLGMLYCLYKKKVDSLFKRRPILYWVGCALMVFAAVAVVFIKSQYDTDLLMLLKHIIFAFAVLLATMKVQIHNKLLHFCGKHLFSIFILQRLPMLLLDYFGLSRNMFVFVSLSLVLTILICIPFDWALGKLDTVLFKKKPKPDAPARPAS